MEMYIKKRWPIRLGKRILKTALAVYICFMIYLLRGGHGIPFYAAISAIFCMQNYTGNTREMAVERVASTFIGAFYGSILLTLYIYGYIGEFSMYLWISVGVVVVIESCVMVKKPQAAYFSCVVFLSIVANHIQDADPFLFVINRVLDTCIGVGVALIINTIRLPRRRQKDILFAMDLDDDFLEKKGGLSNYSKVTWNRMIARGAEATVVTERSASFLTDFLEGIHVELPVIAMNGAVLYDIRNHKYVHKHLINKEVTKGIKDICERTGVGYFVNILVQDVLLTYFTDIKNERMQEIYRQKRQSISRNYIYGELPRDQQSAYFYITDVPEKIMVFKEQLQQSPYAEEIYTTEGIDSINPAYSFLKIYARNATIPIMIQHIKRMAGTKEIVYYSKTNKGYDMNRVVRSIQEAFEPIIWKTNRKKK